MSKRGFVNLTDVTLADEDTNWILTDNAKRVFQGKMAMQVMTKFVTNAIGAIWLPNWEIMQVTPAGGQI